MHITQSSGISPEQVIALAALQQRCQQKDGRGIRVYWQLISKLRAISGDFCLYSDDGDIIAYLGVFLFNQDEAEICAMVDPRYRQQGLFTLLMGRALDLLKPLQIKKLVFSALDEYVAVLAKYHPKSVISEYSLHRDNYHPPELVHQFMYTKRLAQDVDIDSIVDLDVECLHDDSEKLCFHYQHHVHDKDRKIWLLYDAQVFIGKIHVHHQDAITVIHNICIKPEHQGRGYAYYFLALLLQELNQSGHYDIRMEVESPNARALSLYQRLDFAITEQFDFWEVSFEHGRFGHL